MRISRVGGIIAAASPRAAKPLLQVGSIPIIRRIVITFQQAGIFPIAVITGSHEDEVRYELADYGVIFLPHGQTTDPKLLDCAKIGLRYLQDKCDRVVFAPVNIPMFTPDTLGRLIHRPGVLVSPRFHGQDGHPFVLDTVHSGVVTDYDGPGGLREALAPLEDGRVLEEVEDPGILTSVRNEEELNAQLERHNRAILRPRVHLSLEREAAFFSARLKLLLFLISDTGNMRRACEAMALSYSKAWTMINALERELGYFVVERTHGGKRGGTTHLTQEGETLLLAYQRYEEQVFQYAQSQFHALFILPKIMG